MGAVVELVPLALDCGEASELLAVILCGAGWAQPANTSRVVATNAPELIRARGEVEMAILKRCCEAFRESII